MPKRYRHCYNFPSPAGTARWYVRRKVNGRQGPKIRVHGDYGSAVFEQNYHAILAGNNAPPKREKTGERGTLRWLVQMWMQSSDWSSAAKATIKQRDNILARVVAEAGDWDFTDIREADIREGRERRKDTPAAANNFLKTMKALFKWAKENGLVEVDPAKDVKKLRLKSEGFPAWTLSDVEMFRARWPLGTRERLALELLLHTGLRRGDVVRLGRQHVKDGVASIKAEKTGVQLFIPILPELEAVLAASPTSGLTYLQTTGGSPMVKESFGNWFRDACNASGVTKSAHGLRKLAATILANTSGSGHELQALFGWKTNAQSEVYTREADKRQLALQAASKLRAGLGESSPPHGPGSPPTQKDEGNQSDDDIVWKIGGPGRRATT